MTDPLQWLFMYTDDVRFELSGDIDTAVDRLSRLAGTPLLQATFAKGEPSLVGSVSQNRIRLRKATPLFGNIFKPVLFGHFQERDHKILLVGTFEMGSVARVAIGILVVFSLALQILLLPGLIADFDWGLFDPLLFVGGGIALVWLVKTFSQRDVAWIKREIESALR